MNMCVCVKLEIHEMIVYWLTESFAFDEVPTEQVDLDIYIYIYCGQKTVFLKQTLFDSYFFSVGRRMLGRHFGQPRKVCATVNQCFDKNPVRIIMLFLLYKLREKKKIK